MPDLTPIYLSLKLAVLTAAILLLIVLPVAYALSCWKSKLKVFVESIISLPLVLPPTVLGFYLLLLFSPRNLFGQFLDTFNIQISFSFTGILIASIIYNIPFILQPIQKAFEGVPKQYWNISASLGKSRIETLIKIIIPNIKNAIITGVILVFAHTMGEFGVILMIGGNIPGITKTASLAIYSDLEALNYDAAHFYSIILLSISMTVILLVNFLNRKTI